MAIKCPKCQFENPAHTHFCGNCAAPLTSAQDVAISKTITIQQPPQAISRESILAGKYKIIEPIGRGGMGVVYKAEDIKLERIVALKFLPAELTDNPEARERFVREAKAAAALSHPHICTVHEINEEGNEPFIVMEYVEGQSLKEKIRKGALAQAEALDIAIQVAEGLEEAHGKGIIHRDIKPGNIMVTDKGTAKVMDFGLAKVFGASLITKEAKTMGTVAYMSPEQAQGQSVDHRTDIWSLGVVLYEMLSGQLPFGGDREASILYSVVHEERKPLKEVKRDIPPEVQKVIDRALKKDAESRYQTAAEFSEGLRKYQEIARAEEAGVFNLRSLLHRLRQPKIAVPAAFAIIAVALFSVCFFKHRAKVRWAREVALPEMEKRIEESNHWRDLVPVYRLAEKAEAYIPHDSRLAGVFSKCSLKINIKTEPPGAKIFIKEYVTPEGEWQYLGISPIEKIRLPVGVFRWKLDKEGYETVLAAASTWNVDFTKPDLIVPYDLVRTLDKKESIPPGMVRVTGAETNVGKLDDFYIDKYEITNKQYKEFVNGGGYRNKKFWKERFVKGGKELTWEEAVKGFVDQTGIPGPAGWQAGDYPEGQGDYPVSGISWYEAAAYAEFAGKSLPTVYHWGIARGEETPMILNPAFGGFALLAPFSNFLGKGPVPVGSLPGITAYGAFDMAGNVREWCLNETPKGRRIRGGGWGDNSYMFAFASQAASMDRSDKNGFRCALYPEPEKMPASTFQMVGFTISGETEDYTKQKPVADSIFRVYKEQFSYDKTDLKARVESKKESPEWSLEKISFDAAYGGERVMAWLFLPKNSAPPYQTVIYFGGGAPIFLRSMQDVENFWEFAIFLSFLVKNGRAVLYPVYKGFFERGNDASILIIDDWSSHQWSEVLIQQVKDLRRCIDYLETRPDIDIRKLAFEGMSLGSVVAPIILAVEERLSACVLLAGGLMGQARPQVNPINYITRVRMPTLMLNGKYDSIFPLETSSNPMFNLLGTPAGHKELKLYETDHLPPANEFIKKTLAWLDKYLGPVNR